MPAAGATRTPATESPSWTGLETKELIGGYIVVRASSLENAGRLATRYLETVGAEVVDLRELE